jgi:tetratricopeptide (TPR) repeat protein
LERVTPDFLQRVAVSDRVQRYEVIDSRIGNWVGREPRPAAKTDLLRDQTDQRQRRALELLEAGQTDAALDVLNESFDLVMALIDFRPGDTSLEVRLGYLYKDLAQIFEDRDRTRFNRYVENGLQTFQRLVELRLPDDELASCWNGLGNMYLLREDFDQAVDCCLRAVEITPDYSYAWNDLLLGYEGQARNGKVNLAGMRRALARLKATVRGDALLTPGVARAQESLRRWELLTKSSDAETDAREAKPASFEVTDLAT